MESLNALLAGPNDAVRSYGSLHPLHQQKKTTVAGTPIPSTSSSNPNEPWLQITDISFSGHLATQRQINRASPEGYDIEQAFRDLPDLLSGHARIYDINAGGVTPALEKYLRPLFPGIPKVNPDSKSLIGSEDTRYSKGTVGSQWAQRSGSASQWNPLHVPCTYFPVEKQYDDLDFGPSFALFSCNIVTEDKLLVLYERPFDSFKAPMSRPLGPAYADSIYQTSPQSNVSSREAFTKFLLLVLFQLHIESLTRVCQRTFPSGSHEMLYRGTADVQKKIARIRNCTEYHKHVCRLVDMTELTARHLEIETSGLSPTSIAEYIIEVKSLSAQLARISRDNMDRYQHGWDAYREIINVHESQSVKRLTMLATVFLPLSLSSSILAMSTRLVDLHLLLYDFVGVSLILGSLAFTLYSTIAAVNELWARYAKEEKLSRIEMEKEKTERNSSSEMFIACSRWIYWDMLEIWYSVFLVAFWIGLTVSFVIGMVDDVMFGLKFLGYFTAGIVTLAIIASAARVVYEIYRTLNWTRTTTFPHPDSEAVMAMNISTP
ncbi:MAG: hypothetical protein LQ338_008061 [Usnochroma carphineum]|nr:MAG: hypothetical protein LQ338_008061 [Usnochroma carphineum]